MNRFRQQMQSRLMLQKRMQSRLRKLLPDAKIVSYGKAMSFKSEGDMYEYVTGHRSAVIDEYEKKQFKNPVST